MYGLLFKQIIWQIPRVSIRQFQRGRSISQYVRKSIGPERWMNVLDFQRQARRISDCLHTFQLAWEYLLFDNRMIQARTRLVCLLVRST